MPILTDMLPGMDRPDSETVLELAECNDLAALTSAAACRLRLD